MRPSCRMPISSAMAKASCWSCVTRIAVAPLALMMSRSSSDSRSRRSTSRLEKGSSSSSSSGRGRQRARERDALLLAAGELVRVLVERAGEADERGELAHARVALGRVAAQPEADVAGDVEVREQRVVLEHHADAALLGRHGIAGRRARPRRRGGSRPACTGSNPAMQRSTVVLPQPLGPSRQPIAPRASEKVSPRTTSWSP